MNVGTKSVLFGAHQFILHPMILFIAWWRLYGFPSDYRLWVAFIVHDLGYVGQPNMDGPEEERHVIWGAWLMHNWFGPEWGRFCLYHSRFYSKRANKPFSRLCIADKLAIVIEPWWLYLPRVWLSGEVHEYMRIAAGKSSTKYSNMGMSTINMRAWHESMVCYLRDWIDEHKDGREDNWTLAPVKKETP